MPKPSRVQAELPSVVAVQLRQLGEDLALARKRRRESRKVWAGRIGVSEPTLVRMEAGDPGVAVGTYATALWLMGRAPAIGQLAAPQQDLGALETELRAARQRSVRKPHSIEQRLREGPFDAQPRDSSVAAASMPEPSQPDAPGAREVNG